MFITLWGNHWAKAAMLMTFEAPRQIEAATANIIPMKRFGMILLAVYIILDSLLGFGLNLGPAIFLLYLIGLIAGALILFSAVTKSD